MKSVEEILAYIDEQIAALNGIMQMEMDEDGVESTELKTEREVFSELRDWIIAAGDGAEAKGEASDGG